MDPLVLLALLTIVLIVLPLLVFPGKEHKFHPGAVSLQALVTVVAVLIAGYWYLIERRGTAHANLEIAAKGVRLSGNLALVEAHVAIRNAGQIVLSPREWDVRLLAVVPGYSTPIRAAAADAARDFQAWPDQLEGKPAYFRNELQWTSLRRYSGPAEHEVEPGERDVRTFDFVVPCDVKAAKLTVALRKPEPNWWQSAEAGREWWWKDRLLIGLTGLCDSKAGTVAALGESESKKGEDQ